jgi:hypothetical protein
LTLVVPLFLTGVVEPKEVLLEAAMALGGPVTYVPVELAHTR